MPLDDQVITVGENGVAVTTEVAGEVTTATPPATSPTEDSSHICSDEIRQMKREVTMGDIE